MNKKQKLILLEAIEGEILDLKERIEILNENSIKLSIQYSTSSTELESTEKHHVAVLRDVISRISVNTNVILYNLGRLDFALNPE